MSGNEIGVAMKLGVADGDSDGGAFSFSKPESDSALAERTFKGSGTARVLLNTSM